MSTKRPDQVYDIRTLSRKLQNGSVQRNEYDKYVNSLPDDSENSYETRPGDPDYEASLEEAKQKRIEAKAEAAAAAAQSNE